MSNTLTCIWCSVEPRGVPAQRDRVAALGHFPARHPVRLRDRQTRRAVQVISAVRATQQHAQREDLPVLLVLARGYLRHFQFNAEAREESSSYCSYSSYSSTQNPSSCTPRVAPELIRMLSNEIRHPVSDFGGRIYFAVRGSLRSYSPLCAKFSNFGSCSQGRRDLQAKEALPQQDMTLPLQHRT